MADWFADNAPKAQAGSDWFAANAAQVPHPVASHAPEKTLAGFVGNVGNDIIDTATGLGHLANPLNWPQIVKTLAVNQQAAEQESAADVKRIIEGTARQAGSSLSRLSEAPAALADELYQHPVNAALTA